MIYQHAEYCGYWYHRECNCGVQKLIEQRAKPVPAADARDEEEVPLRCVFGWHLYFRHSGMMGDHCVTCVNCNASHYTSHFQQWLYRITGRVVTGEVVYKDGRYRKA